MASLGQGYDDETGPTRENGLRLAAWPTVRPQSEQSRPGETGYLRRARQAVGNKVEAVAFRLVAADRVSRWGSVRARRPGLLCRIRDSKSRLQQQGRQFSDLNPRGAGQCWRSNPGALMHSRRSLNVR